MDYKEIIKKVANKVKEEYSLSPKEKRDLIEKGSSLLRKIQKNIKEDKNLFDNLSFNDKIILLSYVVFLRQNLTTTQGDKLNVEDAALIFHKKIYKDKKDEEPLNKNLKKQLSKIGIKKE